MDAEAASEMVCSSYVSDMENIKKGDFSE